MLHHRVHQIICHLLPRKIASDDATSIRVTLDISALSFFAILRPEAVLDMLPPWNYESMASLATLFDGRLTDIYGPVLRPRWAVPATLAKFVRLVLHN